MKKKSIRILLVLILFLAITSMQNKVNAKESFIRRIENDVRVFDRVSNDTEINVDEVTDEIVGIGQILTFVGTGIFVGSIAYMGIKYMTTSSPEKQAALKIQTVGLLVSGVVIFGAYPIWCIVIDILKVASS